MTYSVQFVNVKWIVNSSHSIVIRDRSCHLGGGEAPLKSGGYPIDYNGPAAVELPDGRYYQNRRRSLNYAVLFLRKHSLSALIHNYGNILVSYF